jgi:hypothetical protein
MGGEKPFYDFIVPGDMSHSQLYCGKVQPGEQIWDRIHKCWMAEGTDYILEATKGDTPEGSLGNGLGYSTFDYGFNFRADDAMVLRVVDDDGTVLTEAELQSVVDWAKGRLTGGVDGYPIGPEYDQNWLGQKEVYGSKYHCSELIWAAYKGALGIELDADMSPFNINISPDDLILSEYTSVIACEIGDGSDGSVNWFNAAEDISKVYMELPWIYYYWDHDGFGAGRGEMYVHGYVGQYWCFDGYGELWGNKQPGYIATGGAADYYDDLIPLGWMPEYGFFSQLYTASIGDYEYWERDPVYYNDYPVLQITGLINNDCTLRLQATAGENDNILGIHPYGTWYDLQEPTEWNARIGQGEYDASWNEGDCYYHVHYEIEAAY